MIVVPALALAAICSAYLFVYGANLVYLTWRAARLPPASDPPGRTCEEKVVVQLPIYNERYVAERLLDAVCGLEWPRHLIEIQVLDDSDDDTQQIIARRAAHWRRAGTAVVHVRRGTRAGYKAGALAHGLTLTDASLVAVFDADFVPRPDFLRRLVPALSDPRVAFVQARWGHLNEDYSLLTCLQALMTDFHFLVEQSVRHRLGYLANFTGSAGVWRRTAIEDAGGWSAATLTEDLDLSYRAQLRGWRTAYLEDVVVPQELPVSADGYRSQQSRWATGSFQCAARLLVPLLRSRLRPAVKFQGLMHLLGYMAPVAMLVQLGCYAVLLAARAHGQKVPWLPLPASASLLSLAPSLGIAVAQWRRGLSWWQRWYGMVGWSLLGAGTSLTVFASLFRALRGGGEFRRTPKYRVEILGEEWRSKAYFRPADLGAAVELGFGLALAALAEVAAREGQRLVGFYAGMFAAGFVYLSTTSLVQSLRQVRYEVAALRLRPLLPRLQAPALLAGLGLGLLMVAQVLPDPFEDSYQHWLIAANLATTGRLQDPLFQMQDTWLPAYHVLAAGLLRAFGTWQLGALRAADALLGVATLALTYRLAGTRRRGLIAVALLALNPVFLLTATQAVAEPLLVTCLLGALVAASPSPLAGAVARQSRRSPSPSPLAGDVAQSGAGGGASRWLRPAWAAGLASLACLTGTKAWLWLASLALALLAERLLRRQRRLSLGRPLAWVAPALALALVLQAGFGFASHSVARAAVEVGSATARGSVPGTPLGRAGEFVGYFALASVPIAALAPLGLWLGLRRPSAGSARIVTLIAVPSLLYLAAVTALVFAGAYTGSHRYYYPALPGLALAAATAVDRWRPPLVLAPIGVAAVVAAAFVPVLNGLAADNRGLRAAGVTASMLPGALLTDSPVAAYWSHKPPAEIYGSRELPETQGSAPVWLRAHAVGGLVLEDVSYYRATSALPDLVRGHPSPPYLPVGDQAIYTVPGGKRVLVYRIGPVKPVTVADGVQVALEEDGLPGRGKTAPLAKGVVLEVRGQDAAGEGMGLGVPIVRYPDGWHYPGSATTADATSPAGPAWRRTYELDTVGGDQAHGYRFQGAPSVGRVEVTYRPTPGSLRVEVRVLSLAPGALQVEVLNEESAVFDNYADASGTRIGPAFGPWEAVPGDWARLRSGALGVEWAQEVAGRGELYAGRESRPPDFDWSGLDYQFGPDLRSVDYVIKIGRGT